MSRRAIKRYEEALVAQQRGSGPSVETETDAEDADGFRKERPTHGSSSGPVNMFGALLADADDEDGTEVEENAQKEIDINDAFAPPEPEDFVLKDAVAEQKGTGKKRRKRKKRKGRKGGDDDEDWFVGDTAPENGFSGTGVVATDDAELLRDPSYIPEAFFSSGDDEELKDMARHVMKSVLEIAYEDGVVPGDLEALARVSRELVIINPQMLKADAELKRLFGTRVVEEERVTEEIEEAQMRRRRGGGGPRVRRKVHLVQPRDTWWPRAPGLGMVLDDAQNESFKTHAMEGEENVRYFHFKYEPRYEIVQEDYRAAVQTHNPNMLVQVINQYPFHVDTLLQLGEVYRQTGEFDRAGELVSRALFVLESTWHRAFKPFNGDCRLSHSAPENGSFFIALFWHVQLLARRCLFRSALESGKLLLNLDPPFDPMGALLMIDSLALRCGEYGWVRAMHRDYFPCPLELFPNFAISASVAAHRQEELRLAQKTVTRGAGSKAKKTDDRTQFSPLANERGVTPLEQLTNALLTFPMALHPILSALEQEGTQVCDQYELFKVDEMSEEDAVLSRIYRVYAVCSKEVWTGSTLQLLRDAAVCAGAAAAGGRGSNGIELAEKGVALRSHSIKFFRRSEAYNHVRVADFVTAETNIPAELMAPDEPEDVFPNVLAGDFPDPGHEANDGAGESHHGEGHEGDMRPRPEAGRSLSTAEAALAFFRSFLPWNTTPDGSNLATTASDQERIDPVAWDQMQEMLARGEGSQGEEEEVIEE